MLMRDAIDFTWKMYFSACFHSDFNKNLKVNKNNQ